MLAACCLSSVSLFTSCDDYDDTELWNKVNGLEERIAALEEWQKTTDNNLNYYRLHHQLPSIQPHIYL